MPKVGFQLHALTNEIVQFARGVLSRRELYAAGISYVPNFVATKIEYPEHDDLSRFDELVITTEPIRNIDAAGVIAFLAANCCCLQVRVPRIDGDTLRQVSVGTVCEDNAKLAIWKAEIARLRRQTIKGAWVSNPTLGTRAYYPHLAATPDAVAKSKRNEIRLLAFAGENVFHFEDEVD
jgi:hypothetical protein